MIILLSPSKTMDTDTPIPLDAGVAPVFADEASALVKGVKGMSLTKLKELLGVSDKLAQLNYDRYQSWSRKHTVSNSRPAIYTFKGDAYVGLDGFTLRQDELDYAQDRLMILSGVYGVLRPKDLMQPYRLEMGGSYVPKGAKNMLGFWKPRITEFVQDALSKDSTPWVMNLASAEYSNAIDFKALDVPVVTPKFLENKNGSLKMVSSFAKKARGLMTRWLIEKTIQDRNCIMEFDSSGYSYSQKHSSTDEPTFVR